MNLQSLSVLDQSAVGFGNSQAAVIRETLSLAQRCEEWGYERFWVSEHHSHPTIVGTAPEILMAAIATQTKKIRIGSAGVMLPHYSALKVAEQFRVLDALAPGRIDLGVGRAPGSDGRTAQLLNPDLRSAARFPEQIQDLQHWLGDIPFEPGHPARGIHAYPLGETAPEVWVLGSSDYGAQVAAHFGLPYVFAHFITEGQGAQEAIELYRARFTPSRYLSEPKVLICVWALTARTEEEAFFQFRSRARFKMDRGIGVMGAIKPPKEALDGLDSGQRAHFEQLCQRGLVGNPEQVYTKLNTLSQDLGVNECAVITWTHDFAARLDSYELLARQHHTQAALKKNLDETDVQTISS